MLYKIRNQSLAILLICFIWSQVSVGTITATDTDEPLSIETRLDTLERLLTDVIKQLDNMHSTYVTREILEYELQLVQIKLSALDSTVGTELSALDSTVGTELSALNSKMLSLESVVEVQLKAQDDKLDRVYQTQWAIIVLVLGTYIPEIMKRFKNN